VEKKRGRAETPFPGFQYILQCISKKGSGKKKREFEEKKILQSLLVKKQRVLFIRLLLKKNVKGEEKGVGKTERHYTRDRSRGAGSATFSAREQGKRQHGGGHAEGIKFIIGKIIEKVWERESQRKF